MENYYQKYKLSSLYFGAYYSGDQYFFPSNTLSELDFNRYNNPYYIDFIDLPKTGIISLFNYLEPIYSKANISGSDQIYSLPERTDTINVDLAKIKRVYAEKNSLKDLKTSINYFGNNLSFVLSGANLQNNEWSNEEDLNLLINRLNFSYNGNIDIANGYNGFSGKGYLLQNCSGCIDTTELIKVSGSNANLNCQDCLISEQYDVIEFSINLNYNPYNLLSETNKNIILNSEKINLSDLSTSNFITFTANDQDLQDAFSLTNSTQDKQFYRDKNYLPLLFRNLNLNSKKLIPFVGDEYYNDYILNKSGDEITSYKYVPNIYSQKVFGSRIIYENSILSPRDISLQNYSKDIYSALFSGNEVYEYNVSNNEYIPDAEQIQERYFKYSDICGNDYLTPRRPVQVRLSASGLTPQQIFLNESLSSGANLGYSISLNGSGDTVIATAPNATLNNVANIGLVIVVTGKNNNWNRVAKLTGSDSAANDQFGSSSCMNRAGTIFAIGAPNARINNISGAGAVYIFTGKNQNWSGAVKITGSPSNSGDQFGSSLSMNSAGNVLIVGAPRANNLSGAAYIFTGNQNNWRQYSKIDKKIWNYSNETNAYFGYSVSMNNSGNLVAIGSPNENISGGLVYIYTGDSYNNINWNYADHINNAVFSSGIRSGDYFGYSLDLNTGDILAVGAPEFNEGTGLCSIFNINLGNITRVGNFSGTANSGFFGYSVALNATGNVLLVGSPGVDLTGNNVSSIDAGLSTVFVNTTGWEFYSSTSNVITYELFGSSVAINDTGNVIVIGAIGASSADGNLNAGAYYISPREQTCPDITLLDQNPVEEYTIPNIEVQLDAMDNYSLNQGEKITYWKNKVNFGKGYNNLYNSGNAISLDSNIKLIDISGDQYSGLLDYNNAKSGDYVTFNNIKFIHSIHFSGITGLNTLINNINNISGSFYRIRSEILNSSTLLLSTSGSNFFKRQVEGLPIITNYLSGTNQGFLFYNSNVFYSDAVIDFQKQANNIKNIYACRHSKVGETSSLSREEQIFNAQTFRKEYFLGILNNGKITGFGTNVSGRLIGTLSDPIFSGDWNSTPVGKITGAVKLSLGSDFALALLDNRRITGWGNDFSGKATFGNNLTGVIDISAGGNHSLALLANGRVTGWGDNTFSQALGGNDLTGVSGISAGWLHSLALLNVSGRITGWGYNEYSQASAANNVTGAKEISAGKFHSLAILNSANRITGWGDDYCNQLTQIHGIQYSYSNKFTGISEISLNTDSILIVTPDRKISGAGSDLYGRISFASNLTGVIKAISGPSHSMAILTGNKLTGWGLDTYGEATSGNYLTGVIDVSLGNQYSLALLQNEKITGWGYDYTGQATNGNNLTGVIGISVGFDHSLALLKNGKITGWGNNTNNEANGGNDLTGVTKVSAGYGFSLALLNNNTLTGWGYDVDGQVTNGLNLTGVIDISAGVTHSLSLLENNKVTGWGNNSFNCAIGGNSLTGVSKISAGNHSSVVILQNKSVTGWGNPDIVNDLFNITSSRTLGPTGFSGISAGLFGSYAFSGDNKKIISFGPDELNFNLISSSGSLSPNQLQTLSKNNFAQGINFSAFITENPNSGSLRLIPEDFLGLNFNIYSGGMEISDIYSSTYLKSGKYIYSLSGSGFSNVVQNYPSDDTLLPQYQEDVIPSVFFNNFSTMVITGYSASLPISIFFLETGPLNSNQKTIQSFYNTGCYISTLNTGRLINLTGIGDPIKVNEPFYSDIQVGNLIMDTGRFEYYLNNTLIYSGSTGFNFGQIALGNTNIYTGTQPSNSFDAYPVGIELDDLTGINKGFNGNILELLIYSSGLNDLNRNEVFYYLTNKWQSILNFYPAQATSLTNSIVYNEKTKTNCSNCSPLLNNLPNENERHILLFEYNLYGYSGTDINDCDMDMHVYMLRTGFYEDAPKEPLLVNLDIGYISGSQKSISKINARSQNVYNVADFNYTYNKIEPSEDKLKTLQSALKLQQPIRTYFTGEYLKYPKMDGNGI